MEAPRPEPDPRQGRRRLVDAARRLFDEHGVHGVSARSIAQAAGHRNVAAVNYHFGDLRGLLQAVLSEHVESVNDRRNALLDELEAAGPVTPRDAIRVIISPLVDLLATPEGRQYLRLVNQLANHPEYADEVNVEFASGLVRAAAHMEPVSSLLPDALRPHRVQNAIGLVLFSLARQARLMDTTAPVVTPLDTTAFTEELVRAIEVQLRA